MRDGGENRYLARLVIIDPFQYLNQYDNLVESFNLGSIDPLSQFIFDGEMWLRDVQFRQNNLIVDLHVCRNVREGQTRLEFSAEDIDSAKSLAAFEDANHFGLSRGSIERVSYPNK